MTVHVDADVPPPDAATLVTDTRELFNVMSDVVNPLTATAVAVKSVNDRVRVNVPPAVRRAGALLAGYPPQEAMGGFWKMITL